MNDTRRRSPKATVSARNAVPGGALVATLRLGTPVTQMAKHENFILCTFPYPSNPALDLEGWVAEQAFIPGPLPPPRRPAPADRRASCSTSRTSAEGSARPTATV